MKKIKFSENFNNIRIDHYLTTALELPRSRVSKMIANKLILVNDEIVNKPGLIIKANDLIIINDEIIVENKVLAKTDLIIPIIYEDEWLMIINKPKNVLVHPTHFNENSTLVNFLSEHLDITKFNDETRPGIVHRLDKNTNGLLIVAKDQSVLDLMQKQISIGQVQRKYQALVHSHFNHNHLMIKAPLMRSSDQTTKMIVTENAQAVMAITEIKLIKNLAKNELAWIECILHTGKTHQIRAHLKYIHHPVFNDPLYGNFDGYNDYEQFLTATSLSFVHPITKKLLTFNLELDKIFLKVIEENDRKRI